ncbi:MAG TPA: hypothetical protein VLZ07_10085 [Syntrophales bacterium]|nr:hypothetical protein [Syntrophales bacterium]
MPAPLKYFLIVFRRIHVEHGAFVGYAQIEDPLAVRMDQIAKGFAFPKFHNNMIREKRWVSLSPLIHRDDDPAGRCRGCP